MTASSRKQRKKSKHKSESERFREWYKAIDGGKGYLYPEEEEKMTAKKRRRKIIGPSDYLKGFLHDLEHYWPNKTGLPGLKVFSRKLPKKVPREFQMPNLLERRFRKADVISFADAIAYAKEEEWEHSDSYPFPETMKLTVPDDTESVEDKNDTMLQIFERTELPPEEDSNRRILDLDGTGHVQVEARPANLTSLASIKW
eukprot:CAMPEP_0170174252 /NCGR_PEP_ID=MMETSP0040_2-20121228/7491_1 /TAXON_ID=641309 /ORGANISM="Lotharella oceanica, Strain CCMP622" /LENGTH=199 /DNA_ID=CAMNT_0010415805 /DNA_START=106 /DNA_END=703 /DNA_ORIENTATION=-